MIQTHKHTRTHTHTLSLSISLARSLARSLSLSLFLSLTYPLTLPPTPSSPVSQVKQEIVPVPAGQTHAEGQTQRDAKVEQDYNSATLSRLDDDITRLKTGRMSLAPPSVRPFALALMNVLRSLALVNALQW